MDASRDVSEIYKKALTHLGFSYNISITRKPTGVTKLFAICAWRHEPEWDAIEIKLSDMCVKPVDTDHACAEIYETFFIEVVKELQMKRLAETNIEFASAVISARG